MADKVLDATGLLCPLPAVKTALALEKMETGQVLEVITTDEISLTDLPRWCQETGHELVEVVEEGPTGHIFIKKSH